MQKNLRILSLEELTAILKQQGYPKYRAKQVYEWVWNKNTLDFDLMLNLPKDLRTALASQFTLPSMVTDQVQKSRDGTLKFRFQLPDVHKIESVLIPVRRDERYTVCVSSQVGCSLSCKFCATGTMERHRNLLAHEIIDQYNLVEAECLEHYGKPLTNVVYMGMGEPLLNFKELTRSIDLFSDVLEKSPRRITVSTAGIAKMITKLADHGKKVNLALSLHAADDVKRNEIMPINEKNNLAALMDAMADYYQRIRTKMSFEYICLNGFNDSLEDANQLAKLTRRFPVRINIIEYNRVEGFDWKKTPENQMEKFAGRLQDLGCLVTVRRSRGKDIDAACGQLANKG